MEAQIVEQTNKYSRSFTVRQEEGNFITIKKVKKNTEYEVEVLVFNKADIDELSKIRNEIYAEMLVDSKSIKDRMLSLIERLTKK